MRLISLNIAQNILNFTRMHYLFFSYILFAISAYSKEYKTPKLTIDSNYIPNMLVSWNSFNGIYYFLKLVIFLLSVSYRRVKYD